MEANDERWNNFVEAYGKQQEKIDLLAEYVDELLSMMDIHERERLEEILNGKG